MTRKRQQRVQVISHIRTTRCVAVAVTEDSSGHNLCNFPVREVRAEADDGALVSAEEDLTPPEGYNGLRHSLSATRIERSSYNAGEC